MADQNSILCPNCHERTSISSRARYDSPHTDTLYEIAECNGCDFFVLVVRNRTGGSIRTIYPHTLPKATDERIPEAVKKDFDEALMCLSVGAARGAAVLARRALQTMCKEKGATKKELKDQIDELFTKSVITKDLQGWSHEVRYVGNDAAHPNDVEVQKEDAEEIIDLLESLCEVLYVAPAKAANRKKIREENRNGA